MRAASRAFARLPRVEAVLLRTSGANYRFAPGLSDIDLTVIHRAGGDAETLEFLDGLWRTYRRLKTWLPMLGEVEILTFEEFAQIARLSSHIAKLQKTYVPLAITPTFSAKDALQALVRREPEEPAVPRVLAFAFAKFNITITPRMLAYLSAPTLVHRKLLDRQLNSASQLLSESLQRLGIGGFEPAADGDPLIRQAAQCYGNIARVSACLVNETLGTKQQAVSRAHVGVPEELEQFCERVFGDLNVSMLWSRPIYFPNTLAMAVITEDDLGVSTFTLVAERLLRFHRDLPRHLRPLLSGTTVLRHFRVSGFPLMLSRSAFRCLGELSPFYFPSFTLSRRPSLVGAPLEIDVPSPETYRREILLHYRGFLALKNNWQASPTPEARIALYRATTDYINGYTSFVRGSGLAGPTEERRDLTLLEAYRELRQSLRALGEALGV